MPISPWDRPAFMGGYGAQERGMGIPGLPAPPQPPAPIPVGGTPTPQPGIPGTGTRQTARPATPAQPPAVGGYPAQQQYQPPQPQLTQAMYNWMQGMGGNQNTFLGMYGPQAQQLWNQGQAFNGNVNDLPDIGQQGGWSQQAGTGAWGYTAPGQGNGMQQYQQQAPQQQQPNQMGYRPPNQNFQTLQGYMPPQGSGNGWSNGGFGGGGLRPQYGGGGMQSQYGNSAYGGQNSQLLQLLQQLLRGY